MKRPARRASLQSSPPRLAARPPDLHKGQAGRVAIVAGSRDLSGAASLCARGALRGGAGLVRVFTARTSQPIVAASEMCVMTAGLPDDADGRLTGEALAPLRRDLGWADVVAVGPGLGTGAGVRDVVAGLLAEIACPVVLDADGLNAAAGVARWWEARRGPTVVTPHPGEFARLRQGARLTDWDPADPADAPRRAAASEYARLTGAVVVLKGHRTVVSDGQRGYVNATGNAGMATGGMGDVLTGLIAALIGQGAPPFEAACLAVHCHGAAGDALARRVGPFGYLAREVADEVPRILALHVERGRGARSARVARATRRTRTPGGRRG